MKNCSFFDHHFHLFTFQIDHLFSVREKKITKLSESLCHKDCECQVFFH